MLVTQSCPILCKSLDCNPPCSSVHEILPRILEWVAIPFSKASFQARDQTQVFCTEGRFFTIWATREAPIYREGRQWHPTPVLLPGKSHWRRSLVGCSPWGLWVGHDWATSLSLSCIGEGNGNPLQCSCLENPRDRRAAISGVAQSQTRLKQLSSSIT